jgi:hypothetical protein
VLMALGLFFEGGARAFRKDNMRRWRMRLYDALAVSIGFPRCIYGIWALGLGGEGLPWYSRTNMESVNSKESHML